jgi:hypothetical protein
MKLIALALLVVLGSLAWAAFTRRLPPLLPPPILPVGILARPRWVTVRRLGLLSLLSVALALFPIGLTLRSAPGAPRLVRCCCCAPYPGPGELDNARRDQAAGRCVICSDVRTGFEPVWYLVW